MLVAEYFDNLYSKNDRYWWLEDCRYETHPDCHPRSLLTRETLVQLAGRKPGRAIDLGAGEGSDAIRLARLNYEVDAIEISEVAAAKIRRFAADANVAVHVAVQDIREFIPNGPYDVVICNGVLHYIEDKASVIDRMMTVTRPGGINVISLWSTYSDVPRFHNSVDAYPDDEDGIVAQKYQDWTREFLYLERDKPEQSHVDMPPHQHSHIKMIARRPATWLPARDARG
jgi:SAM-dependent methyltransferase